MFIISIGVIVIFLIRRGLVGSQETTTHANANNNNNNNNNVAKATSFPVLVTSPKLDTTSSCQCPSLSPCHFESCPSSSPPLICVECASCPSAIPLSCPPPSSPSSPLLSSTSQQLPSSFANTFLAQALIDERFTLQTVERQASHRSERLCIGKRCEGNRFLMVHQDRDSSDRILPFLLRHEHQSMEVFSTVLTSEDCKEKISHKQTATCSHHLRVGQRPLVFDVGANHGFYGLLAASTGAQVVFIDPQPHCIQYVRAATILSGFENHVEIVHAFADSEAHGIMANVPIRSGCWGTFPTTDHQWKSSREEYHALLGGNQTMPVSGISLPALIRKSLSDRAITRLKNKLLNDEKQVGDADDYVLAMKIDAEGHELHILDALFDQGIISEKLVRNFLIEFNKPALKRNEEGGCSQDPDLCYARITQRFIDSGYTVLANTHGQWAGQAPIINSTAFGKEGWTTADMWIYAPR